MSYEEFLNLPADFIINFAKEMKYKSEKNIPFTGEDLEIRDHFIRYTKDLKLQEEKQRLEYFYSLDAYQKDK